MNDPAPVILSYATPKPANRFARMSLFVMIIVSIFAPGLGSSLIRGSLWRCICMLPAIPLAFLFFGPFWDEVLFAHTPWTELGLYPFIATIVVVEICSIVFVIKDHGRALREMNE